MNKLSFDENDRFGVQWGRLGPNIREWWLWLEVITPEFWKETSHD